MANRTETTTRGLKEVFRAHGLTLAGVAAALGVSQSALSQNLSGNPSLAKLREIAAALGMSVGDMLNEMDGKCEEPGTVCPHCGMPVAVTLSKK